MRTFHSRSSDRRSSAFIGGIHFHALALGPRSARRVRLLGWNMRAGCAHVVARASCPWKHRHLRRENTGWKPVPRVWASVWKAGYQRPARRRLTGRAARAAVAVGHLLRKGARQISEQPLVDVPLRWRQGSTGGAEGGGIGRPIMRPVFGGSGVFAAAGRGGLGPRSW
jgi:hypothetical protein